MLVREFLAKNKTVIMPQPPDLSDLASADFFLFPKLNTLMNGKRIATIEEIKEKSKQRLVGDTKKRVSEVDSRIGKNPGLCVLYLRGVTLKGTR